MLQNIKLTKITSENSITFQIVCILVQVLLGIFIECKCELLIIILRSVVIYLFILNCFRYGNKIIQLRQKCSVYINDCHLHVNIQDYQHSAKC